jgi:hypothetical protein
VPTFRLELSATAKDALARDPETYVAGRFFYAGVEYAGVGVRFKGSDTLRSWDDKPSFKIAFGHFVAGQTFLGLDHLTLHAMLQDPARVRESLAYQVFRAAGVPAPRTGYAELVIDGEPYGLYLVVETVDAAFLRVHYDDATGSLYEGDYGDDLHESHIDRFQQEAGADESRADLLAFVRAVHAPGDDIYFGETTPLDTPRFLAFAAVEAALGHWDGYWVAHNYRIYHEPTQDKWTFIPWGTDQTFKRAVAPFAMHGYLGKRCTRTPSCLPAYVAEVERVLDLVATLDLDGRIDDLSALYARAAAADERFPFDDDQIATHVEEIRVFLQEQPPATRSAVDCIADDVEIDADLDGHGRCYADCNDDDDAIHPVAPELCDDVDNDCSGNVDDNPQCPCPSLVIGGVERFFCDLAFHWAKAREWCEAQGLILARIDGPADNDAIWQATQLVRDGNWYVGGSDIGHPGWFSWTDGTPLTFTAWAHGEPSFDGADHCVHLRGDQATWNDLACGNELPFVCQATFTFRP